VLDDTACMVNVARAMSRFLYVESCGQCSPCKLGSGEITASLERIEAGAGDTSDTDSIEHWLARVTDGARCYLATQERLVVASIVEAFGPEVEEHLTLGRCPRPRPFTVPKLTDLAGGVATYDARQQAKQPDWTYTPR
jgi:NADH-quinone oxidoreductase subunit F